MRKIDSQITEQYTNKRTERRNMRKRKSRFLFLIVMFALVGVILFSGYQILSILTERIEGNSDYNKLNDYADISIIENGDDSSPDSLNQIPYLRIDFNALKEINEDIYAWIMIPDTNVNYAVTQCDDNSYYLSHTASKAKNSCGSIFIDCENNPDFSDRKTIIYGHRMNNGSMFENLLKFGEEEFFYSHPYGLLSTENNNYVLEIIAAKRITAKLVNYNIDFESDEEFLNDIEMLKDGALINENVSYDENSKMVMLSTCVKGNHDYRFMVLAKLTDYSQYDFNNTNTNEVKISE